MAESLSWRRRSRIVADRRRSSPVTLIGGGGLPPCPIVAFGPFSIARRDPQRVIQKRVTLGAGSRSTEAAPWIDLVTTRRDATPRSGPGRREAAFFFPVLSACSNLERDISLGRNEESRLVLRKTGSIARTSVELTAFNLIFFLSALPTSI